MQEKDGERWREWCGPRASFLYMFGRPEIVGEEPLFCLCVCCTMYIYWHRQCKSVKWTQKHSLIETKCKMLFASRIYVWNGYYAYACCCCVHTLLVSIIGMDIFTVRRIRVWLLFHLECMGIQRPVSQSASQSASHQTIAELSITRRAVYAGQTQYQHHQPLQ